MIRSKKDNPSPRGKGLPKDFNFSFVFADKSTRKQQVQSLQVSLQK